MTLTGQTVHFPAGTADPEDPAYDPTVNQIIIPFHVLEDSFIEGQEAIDIQIDSYSSSTGKIYPQSDWQEVPGVIGDDDQVVRPDPTLPDCDTCPGLAGMGPLGKGANIGFSPIGVGRSGGGSSWSSNPVRYGDGAVLITGTDLMSNANGMPWGITREWTNAPGYTTADFLGAGTFVDDQPGLLQIDGDDSVALITTGHTALYFDLVSGIYVPRGFIQDKLQHNTTTHEFIVTDTNGAQLHFYDFSSSFYNHQQGQLKSYSDPDGNPVTLHYDSITGRLNNMERSSTVGTTTITEQFSYSYSVEGDDFGLVNDITLQRKVNSGDFIPVRTAVYTYYGPDEPHGNPGDLKTAEIEDENGIPIDTTYYRYYTQDDVTNSAPGYVHGLKFVFKPASLARLINSQGSDLDAIADEDAAPFADNYFEYDSQQRATKEIAQGAGCSVCTGGLGSFTYSYSTSTNADGYNSWKTKTVETLPDNDAENNITSENIVYTNYMGEVMMKVYHHADPINGDHTWTTYTKYDDNTGAAVLIAQPSAVSDHADQYAYQYADLVNYVSGNATYLSDDSGLITTYEYYTFGAVGYLYQTSLKNGETATAVPQRWQDYSARTLGSTTIYLLNSSTDYVQEGFYSSLTTSYEYTLYSGTLAVESVATQRPFDDLSTRPVTVYDIYGRPTWTREAPAHEYVDPSGFIRHTIYDQATGAVAETIVDVDTDLTSDEPSGWTSPTENPLHLVTTYEVDALGRPTRINDANDDDTYIVYKDASHEMRVYPGWDATNHTTTGPIIVRREDRDNGDGYIETLTMSAAPDYDGNDKPTGEESIGSLQSLSRTYFNDAGQMVRSDDYFYLTGMSYNRSPYIGTPNTNFQTTDMRFDDRGRPNRVVHGDGTIYRTVYDGLGRPLSFWIGNDDTPSTGYWSPDNTTGTNLVGQAEYEYDDGGVGDSHRTSSTDGEDRKTTYAYDFRGRLTSTTLPDADGDPETPNYLIYTNDYDNLGRIISTSDPLGHTTTYAYDEINARSMTTTYPSAYGESAPVTVKTFDFRGLTDSLTDPDGNATTWTYDGAGRVATETNELDKTRTYSYDGVGNLTDRIDRDGRLIHYDYDPANRNTYEKWYDTDLTTLVNTIGFTYDDAGRLYTASDTTGAYAFGSNTYTYDALGRATNDEQAINGLTPHVQYASQYNGANQLQQLDATIGTTADFSNNLYYDPLARLDYVTQQGVTGGDTVAAKRAGFGYNDANQYDEISRYAGTSTSELAINTFYGYDGAGRLDGLIHTLDATAPTSGWGSGIKAGYGFTLDDANRMTGINSYIDGSKTYDYDARSELTTEDSNLVYSYDANGNRTSGTIGDNNQLLADGNFNYEYDDEGNLIIRTDVGTGERDEYVWDHRNRLVSVKHWSPDVEPPEGWGPTGGYTCDETETYCFQSIVYAAAEGATVELLLAPSYGTPTLEYWTEDATAVEGSDYDSSATTPTAWSGGTVYFDTSEDALNETTESFKIHVRIQGYPESEIVLEADIDDANGPSLLQKVDYAYNARNQLVRRALDDDGDGANNATDQFFSYYKGQVALQFDGASASDLSHRYFWNPAAVDQLLADEQVTSLSSAGTILWPLADQVGTIRDLATHNSTSHATTIENHRVYDSFGNLTSETNGAIDELFGFTSRQFDESTGLQYNLNRWYDSKSARWMSEDPIEFRGHDDNLYRYVKNKPLTLTDPTGLALPPPFDAIFGSHGNYCGKGNPPQPGWTFCDQWGQPLPGIEPPVDNLDKACLMHDCCLGTPQRFRSLSAQCSCAVPLCMTAMGPNACNNAATRNSCEEMRSAIARACRLPHDFLDYIINAV